MPGIINKVLFKLASSKSFSVFSMGRIHGFLSSPAVLRIICSLPKGLIKQTLRGIVDAIWQNQSDCTREFQNFMTTFQQRRWSSVLHLPAVGGDREAHTDRCRDPRVNRCHKSRLFKLRWQHQVMEYSANL